MVNLKSEYDTNLKWSNWNEYIIASAKILDYLGEIASRCYFQPKLINKYHADLKAYLYTRRSLISNFEKLQLKLKRVEEVIFSSGYLNDMTNNSESPKFKRMQNKVLTILMGIMSEIQEDLSESEIFPKTTKQKKYDPNKAILDSNY